MSTEMQKGNSAQLPAEIAALGNALVAEGQAASGISDLLRFLSREGGIWVFGAEAVENEEGARWAIDPRTFEVGLVCWKNKKIAGEAMVPAGTKHPVKAEMVDHGSYTDGKGKEVATKWDEQQSVSLTCVEGEDKGTIVNFRTSTVGGVGCIKLMAKTVGQRALSGQDYIAIVELTNDFYTHAEFGKTYFPTMEVIEWKADKAPAAAAPAEDATETASEAAEEEIAEDAPVTRRGRGRTATAPVEAAEAPADEAPVRRRRSRSA